MNIFLGISVYFLQFPVFMFSTIEHLLPLFLTMLKDEVSSFLPFVLILQRNVFKFLNILNVLNVL